VVVRDRPDATILTVSGELDVASSPQLRAALDRVDPSPARRVVLDLSELSFIDVTD
jgi:anti-sigma B factor antagonist